MPPGRALKQEGQISSKFLPKSPAGAGPVAQGESCGHTGYVFHDSSSANRVFQRESALVARADDQAVLVPGDQPTPHRGSIEKRANRHRAALTHGTQCPRPIGRGENHVSPTYRLSRKLGRGIPEAESWYAQSALLSSQNGTRDRSASVPRLVFASHGKNRSAAVVKCHDDTSRGSKDVDDYRRNLGARADWKLAGEEQHVEAH